MIEKMEYWYLKGDRVLDSYNLFHTRFGVDVAYYISSSSPHLGLGYSKGKKARLGTQAWVA
jgi:hypothetical protein